MEKEEIIDQMNNVFKMVFEDQNINITVNTTANDIQGWNSLTHMILISEIEKHFKIKFSLNEILNFKNVGDAIRCIYDKKM